MPNNYVAIGSEFTVNNVLLYSQSRPDFARLASGSFVAIWESTDAQQDNSSSGIKGRLIGPNGTPIGSEFLINTATANSQSRPSVAGLAGGGFVVTWTTSDAAQDGNYDSIKAQRFDAAGAKIGPEFLVNSQTSNIQWISSVAELDTGGFVITWETYDSAQDGSGRAIKAQIYDGAGARVGTEFLVNTVTASDQLNADISTLSGGRFIVTWLINIGGKLDVRGQVFDSTGAKIGGEILVNSQTFESQTEVGVTNLANGGFVVTWTTFDTAQDGSGSAIKAQVFDAAGARVGGEILVNTAGAAAQKSPSVAGLANGDFVIAWRTDDQTADDASGAIKAQVFDSTGAKLGAEFRVNSLGASLESEPVVVDLGNGAFAIGWTGSSSPTFDSNIRAQIFSSGSAPVIDSNGGGAAAVLQVAEHTVAVTTVHAFDIDGPATTYAIAGGADAARFTINASTGALSFVAAPDYEAPADSDGDNVYQVVVRASDGSRSDEQMLSVSVASVNEAVAIVSDGGGDSAALTVAEGSTSVTTVLGIDGDGDPVTYSIAGGADAARFTIDAATGALSFVAAPDREAPADADRDNVYQVVVRASDGQLADSQALAVTVGNVNEAPTITFHNWPASESIVSSTPEGWADFGLFGAVDPDGDAVSWTLSGPDAGLFTYDPATGWLRFKTAPDFEAPGSAQGSNGYELTLTASDGTLTDSVAVTIRIRNVNEGLSITSLGGGDSAAVTADENQLAVATVAAVDIDGDAAVFSIVGGADAARFEIDAATGALSFVAAPDHEMPGDADGDGIYAVVVAASDGSFVDTQSLAVTVADVNEGVDIVSYDGREAVALTMAENGWMVGQVVAFDRDGDTVGYAIAGGADAALFAVDAATGLLTFVGRPDFEAPGDSDGDNVYEVEVSAGDGAFTDTQAFSVRIENSNEGIYIVSNGGGTSAAVSLSEGQSYVTTVVAHDPDGTAAVYSIVGGPDAARFAIDAVTGVLTFVEAPDYEAPADAAGANFYTVEVAASDGEFMTWQKVQILVGNVNEGLSITSNGGGAAASLAVSENGRAVTNVAATDVDGDRIVYSIVGGADAARFQIDAATGALSFVAAPDY
ncbi:MAG TPA: cadherin domain-containing protein, partial [Allosphingosinicella sp.]|nr:cadherin domain-containing protein [Allosphingosinicella sp.]